MALASGIFGKKVEIMTSDLRFAFMCFFIVLLAMVALSSVSLFYALISYTDGMVRADAAGGALGGGVLAQLVLSRMGEVVRAMNGQNIPDGQLMPDSRDVGDGSGKP
jgi:hypothetical protein